MPPISLGSKSLAPDIGSESSGLPPFNSSHWRTNTTEPIFYPPQKILHAGHTPPHRLPRANLYSAAEGHSYSMHSSLLHPICSATLRSLCRSLHCQRLFIFHALHPCLTQSHLPSFKLFVVTHWGIHSSQKMPEHQLSILLPTLGNFFLCFMI